MVEVAALTKTYGDKKVIDNVSLRIPKGKITSFIGPNGAGKSTLLSLITRLIPLESGQVKIEGIPLADHNPTALAQKISILKQSNQIGVRLTILELVSFGRFPYSKNRLTAEDHKQIKDAISYMELEDIQHKYLDELSGGQCQRAYIAMIIAQNTEYIFLDEPLNNLDLKHSVQIMRVLRRLVNELGKTIVIVIHDINFASCHSDYIVGLKHGKIIRQGDTSEMITKDVLKELYDMDVKIEQVGEHRICHYFA